MKVAITGGATGIGADVVKKLKAQGHHVTAFDISDPGDNVDRWVQTDLGDPASIAAACAAADGPYQALINNAGLPPRDGMAERVLRVNFIGLRAFLDGMLDHLAPGASIVNTASRAGSMWRENIDQVKTLLGLDAEGLAGFILDQSIDPTRAYNLSKEAVIVMTMARTQEMVGRGLRMNSVSPAAVSTSILDDFVAAFGDKVAQNVARVGRPGLPEEIADVIVFLASRDSAWIKGQDVVADGGMSAMAVSDTLKL